MSAMRHGWQRWCNARLILLASSTLPENSAVSRGSGPIHTFEVRFDQTLDLCLTNTFLCMKYEIEAMLASGGGSIVTYPRMLR